MTRGLTALGWTAAVVLGVAAGGCESDPPAGPDDVGREDAADGDAGDVAPDETADVVEDAPDGADTTGDADATPPCEPLASDYLPRSGSDDDWPPCISDDDAYHPIEASISTIARVASFETIADLLWRRADPPTADDFTAARVIYVETNGLDSRVQRREDLHYPEVPSSSGACTDPGVPETFPDRCAGPGRLLPIIDPALADGSTGEDALGNAARVEAALLWFLYLSTYKEAHTCTETPRDCDSSWAYYTGGEDRASGLGLATYVRRLDPETHDRIWDGLLAVRCWKNLDDETGVSTDLETRDRAIAQTDRALIRGIALIVADRLAALAAATVAAERAAHWEFVRILGGFLLREAAARDAVPAAILAAGLERTDPDGVDVAAMIGALAELFPCP